MSFTVAILGRPNVGKSTLFNRLVGRREALESAQPGMTRDVREGRARLGDLEFLALDTAGHEEGEAGTLLARMRVLTEAALAGAHACLFVIDARAGVLPPDRELAGVLRRSGIPVVLVANKTEGRAGDSGLLECWELGFGEAVAVSAAHRLGMEDLRRALVPLAPGAVGEGGEAAAVAETPVRAAVLGRPNVGKSTLINRLLGAERLLAGPEAGLTRDSVSVTFQRGGREFRIADTAGLRRSAGARGAEEQLAAGDALRSVRFCEVALLLLDAADAFEQQDRRLARMVEEEGRALVIAINKWDLVKDPDRRLGELEQRLARFLPNLVGAPLVPVSALQGEGLDGLLDSVVGARTIWEKRVPTGELNRWLAQEVERHPPRAVQGRRIRLRYIAQTNTRPPTFALFASRPKELDGAYRRYIANGLRRRFGFAGVPIRIMLRGADNPYASKSR